MNSFCSLCLKKTYTLLEADSAGAVQITKETSAPFLLSLDFPLQGLKDIQVPTDEKFCDKNPQDSQPCCENRPRRRTLHDGGSPQATSNPVT